MKITHLEIQNNNFLNSMHKRLLNILYIGLHKSIQTADNNFKFETKDVQWLIEDVLETQSYCLVIQNYYREMLFFLS